MVAGCSHWHSEFVRPLPLRCRPTYEKTDCRRWMTVSELLAPAANVSFRLSVGFMEVPLTVGFGLDMPHRQSIHTTVPGRRDHFVQQIWLPGPDIDH